MELFKKKTLKINKIKNRIAKIQTFGKTPIPFLTFVGEFADTALHAAKYTLKLH